MKRTWMALASAAFVAAAATGAPGRANAQAWVAPVVVGSVIGGAVLGTAVASPYGAPCGDPCGAYYAPPPVYTYRSHCCHTRYVWRYVWVTPRPHWRHRWHHRWHQRWHHRWHPPLYGAYPAYPAAPVAAVEDDVVAPPVRPVYGVRAMSQLPDCYPTRQWVGHRWRRATFCN